MNSKTEQRLRRLASKCLNQHWANAWTVFREEAWAIYNSDDDGPREQFGDEVTILFRSVAANTKGQLRRSIRVGHIPLPDAPLQKQSVQEVMTTTREQLAAMSHEELIEYAMGNQEPNGDYLCDESIAILDCEWLRRFGANAAIVENWEESEIPSSVPELKPLLDDAKKSLAEDVAA
jgi:hypothetical protein